MTDRINPEELQGLVELMDTLLASLSHMHDATTFRIGSDKPLRLSDLRALKSLAAEVATLRATNHAWSLQSEEQAEDRQRDS